MGGGPKKERTLQSNTLSGPRPPIMAAAANKQPVWLDCDPVPLRTLWLLWMLERARTCGYSPVINPPNQPTSQPVPSPDHCPETCSLPDLPACILRDCPALISRLHHTPHHTFAACTFAVYHQGHDDAMAIILAGYSDELNVIGISTGEICP